MSERLWYLKSCDLFQQLSPQQLTALESRCRVRKCPRSTPIYLPADHADGVLLLAEGRVKIGSFTEEGKQTILAFIEPGELFGELSLMGSQEREEYAEAVEKSTVILIPNESIQQLLLENPNVSLGITKLFGLRRKRVERRLKVPAVPLESRTADPSVTRIGRAVWQAGRGWRRIAYQVVSSGLSEHHRQHARDGHGGSRRVAERRSLAAGAAANRADRHGSVGRYGECGDAQLERGLSTTKNAKNRRKTTVNQLTDMIRQIGEDILVSIIGGG